MPSAAPRRRGAGRRRRAAARRSSTARTARPSRSAGVRSTAGSPSRLVSICPASVPGRCQLRRPTPLVGAARWAVVTCAPRILWRSATPRPAGPRLRWLRNPAYSQPWPAKAAPTPSTSSATPRRREQRGGPPSPSGAAHGARPQQHHQDRGEQGQRQPPAHPEPHHHQRPERADRQLHRSGAGAGSRTRHTRHRPRSSTKPITGRTCQVRSGAPHRGQLDATRSSAADRPSSARSTTSCANEAAAAPIAAASAAHSAVTGTGGRRRQGPRLPGDQGLQLTDDDARRGHQVQGDPPG